MLCGSSQSDGFVKYNEEILGYAIKRDTNPRKTIYVSVGHRISLPTGVRMVRSLTKTGEWISEPLRAADMASKDHGNG